MEYPYKHCAYCKFFDEHFDCFGHLMHARCRDTGKYTNPGSTCINFEHVEDSFYTDLNDDD